MLVHRLRAPGRRARRCDRRRQRVARRDLAAGRLGVPRRPCRALPQPRLLARKQPGADVGRRALRAVPQPRHRDRRGHVRAARPGDGPRAAARPGGRPADRLRRRARPDDPPLPERAARTRRRAGRGSLAGAAEVPRRAGDGPRRLRHRGRVRLGERVVHAGPPRGDRQRRLPRRALLHVLGRDGPLPPDQDGRLGDPQLAGDDDHPSRQEGPEQEDREPWRLHADRLCAQALLAAAHCRLRRGRVRPLRAAGDDPRRGRGGPPPPRRVPHGDQDDARSRAGSVRSAERAVGADRDRAASGSRHRSRAFAFVSMSTVVAAIALSGGRPGLAVAIHFGLLALASLFYREPRPSEGEDVAFLILIPAHDEERVIAAGLAAIEADRRPCDRVLVVADRCSDATADIARSFGALVLERGEDEEPGRAAARQAGLEHARELEWDAVLMLDADSVIEPGFFAACEHTMASGADAVQARSESGHGRSLAQEASLAAFTLQGITIPRGRDRLGVSVRLRGTGMAIRREVALAHRFRAPASEDLFFTLDLMLDGVRCRHVDRARLRSEGAGTWGAFGGQKVRYEAGRMAAARAYVPRLLRRALHRRDAACLEAAWFLAPPPFALGVLSLLLGTALAAVAGAWVVAAVLGAGLAALALTLVTGLVPARAGLRAFLALLAAPWYLGWTAVVQLRALASVLRRDSYYGPTARA